MNYSIDEIERLVGISKYTLRYYEKEELIPKIKRNSSGYRVYSEKDLEWLTFLLKVKATGMPINQIKQFSKIMFNPKTIPERRKMLLEHRQKITDQQKALQNSLDAIDAKLVIYKHLQNTRNKN
ncbi:MerR family transcriptional regulator [Oenococcus sp. UCMA 17063]|nr:MerR family transcriptional regulator [Oenococcus sp. UCMA 17063]